MSEFLVEDDSTYPASITVPEDGDARNAASVVVGFQGLANRFAFAMARALGALLNGGTFRPGGSVTWELHDGNLIITGDDDFNIHLGGVGGSPGGAQLFANGNMASHMFTAGRTGRANKKTVTASPATNQTVDPRHYDCLLYSPTGAIEVAVLTNTYVQGDHFTVSNFSLAGGNTITVKDPGGVTLAVVPIHNGSKPGFGSFVYDGANWVCNA